MLVAYIALMVIFDVCISNIAYNLPVILYVFLIVKKIGKPANHISNNLFAPMTNTRFKKKVFQWLRIITAIYPK